MAPGGVGLLADAVGALAADDLAARLVGAELIELHRLRSMLDAQISRRVRHFELLGEHEADGHKTAAAWLAAKCRNAAPHREVRVARAMEQLSELRAAWEAGETTTRHIQVIEAARHAGKADDEFDAFEGPLLEVATTGTVDDVDTVCQRWRDALDATSERDDTLVAKNLERRGLAGTCALGLGSIEITAEALDYDMIMTAVETEADRHQVEGDLRSLSQQRCDALVSICRRELEGRNPGGTNRPHLSLISDVATVTGEGVGFCQTDRGTQISAPSVQRLLCDAIVTGILVDGETVPLSLGRSRRTFSLDQRRALLVSQVGCIFPGCNRPGAQCEGHHIRPWDPDGTTDLDNGALLCWVHHRLLHELRWRLKKLVDGSVEWYRPDGTLHGTHHPPPRPKPVRVRSRRERRAA